MSVCEAELLFFGNATDIWLLLATCDYGGGVVFVADVAWLVQLRLLPLLVVCRTCSWPFGGFGPCCTARRLAATVASMLCNFYNDTMFNHCWAVCTREARRHGELANA